MKSIYLIFLLSFILNPMAMAQVKTDPWFEQFLEKDSSRLIQKVLKDSQTYRLQIIYTQINRDKHNKPSFRNYYFQVDPNNYFNPASTVKLPLACLALEKLKELTQKGINRNTSIQIDSSYSRQTKVIVDETSETGLPSVAQYIRKVFLVSDNDAYNRLYEVIGQQRINQKLHEKGYPGVRITRRFTGMNEDENRHTNAIHFLDQNRNLIYRQPPAYNPDSFDYSHVVKVGHAHYVRDSLIHEPIDFTKANNLPLEDLQQILQSVLFPESVKPTQRFDLKPDDEHFLYQYLSQFPSETNYPKYDAHQYYDSYVKFYFRNASHQMPAGVRVFNKVGWAYGFLTDVSYVADFVNKVEYMLTTTIYVNNDGVLNDDKYDYEETGYPFLYDLGQAIYRYELQRKRAYKPDLNKFKISYEYRDAKDIRPTLKNVDN
ncbi:MAG: serine hydrolase [Siphonobacter sp.]